jgi:NADH-quinone oxidoreductase subunit E
MRVQRIPTQQPQAEKSVNIDLALLNPVIKKYLGKKGNMIPLLQATQELYGFIPKVAFLKLNKEAGLELNEMYGVATFYAQFRLAPVGKHIIRMCHGTACHVQNVTEITESMIDHLGIKDGETTVDGLFTIETVACLGCCSLAPVMMIGEETYGKLSPTEALKIIKEIKRNEQN